MITQVITVIIILLAAVFYSCSKTDNYTGVVYNHQNNKPLGGVRVINYPDSTVTDSLGHFSLPAKGHNGPLLFKITGFYTDSAQTYINHSGEQMDQLFDLGKIYLFPTNGKFRNLAEALKAAEPKPVDTTEIYNYTRDQKFYTRKAGESDFSLVIPAGFTPQKYTDPIIPVKGSNYHYDIAAGDTFLNVTKLNINRVPCRLLVYSTFGENDTRVLNVQLNSYDQNNKIIDALLLDSRFTFDIEYYSQYRIYGDGKIRIRRFSIDAYEQNDEGDIIGERKKPDTLILKEYFRLNEKGQFIAVKQ